MMRRLLLVTTLAACQPTPVSTAKPAPVTKVVPPDAAIVVPTDAAPVAVAIDADVPDDPDMMEPSVYAIRQAFHRRFPVLPMISADGKHVAIDRSYGHGMGYWHAWKYAWFGPDGKLEDKVDVVDEKAADHFNGDGKSPTAEELAARAASVWKKLDGFVAMSKLEMPDSDYDEKTSVTTRRAKVGTTTFALETGLDSVTATWTDASGKVLRKVMVDHSDGSTKGSCNGPARLGDVWADVAHQRIVIEVTFMGNDSCNDDPPEWRVF